MLELKNAKMSSTEGKYTAEKGHTGPHDNFESMCHTKQGKGQWWSAQFVGGDYFVQAIKILNR